MIVSGEPISQKSEVFDFNHDDEIILTRIISGNKYSRKSKMGVLYSGITSGSTSDLFETSSGNTSIVAKNYNSTANGDLAISLGFTSESDGNYSFTSGFFTKSIGNNSHAEGATTTSIGNNSHAEGLFTTAIGNNSHSEGRNTRSFGDNSHSEGFITVSSGNNSHAEGQSTLSIGSYSHSEGLLTTAIGDGSHSEGRSNTTIGNFSKSIGVSNIVESIYGFVGGSSNTILSGSTNSTILGSTNSLVNYDVVNSVIIGGDGITGNTNNTVYTPNLEVKSSITYNSISLSDNNIEWDKGSYFYKTLTSSTTFTFSSDSDGKTIELYLTQDASIGGWVASFPNTVKWSNGLIPSSSGTTINNTDIYRFTKVNGNIYGNHYPNFY